MSTRNSLGMVIVAAVAGGISGGVAVTIGAPVATSHETIREIQLVTAPAQEMAISPRSAGSHDAGAALESETVGRLGGSIVVQPPDRPQPPATDQERLAARMERETAYVERIAEHYREPDDPSWARPAERTISERLGTMVEGVDGVSIVSVDCRRDTCATRVRWDSFDQARVSYRPFIERDLGINCEQHILLPHPDDVSAPYETTMLMTNCVGRQ